MTGEPVDALPRFLPLLAGDGTLLEQLRGGRQEADGLWRLLAGTERELLDVEWDALRTVLPWLAEDSPDPEGPELADLQGLVVLGWHQPAPRGERGPHRPDHPDERNDA